MTFHPRHRQGSGVQAFDQVERSGALDRGLFVAEQHRAKAQDHRLFEHGAGAQGAVALRRRGERGQRPMRRVARTSQPGPNGGRSRVAEAA